MIKITGLNELSKQLSDAEQAIKALEGEILFKFDPYDPASIEAAIAESERAVEEKVAAWQNNPFVLEAAVAIKEQYRQAILEKAEVARLEKDAGVDE